MPAESAAAETLARSELPTQDWQVDGLRKYSRSKLLQSSADRGWTTLSAELWSHPMGKVFSIEQQSVEVVIALSGTDGLVTRTAAGRQEQSRPEAGTVWLVPTDVGPEEIALSAPMPRALHLFLPLRQFDALAEQYSLSKSLVRAVQYVGGLNDDLIRHVGASVLSELTEQTATTRMVAEMSSLMLATRLIQNYVDRNLVDRITGAAQTLDHARMRRVLDYIDQHLEEDFTVTDLAAVAHLSVFHFARTFAATMGMPPQRYVSQRRLAAAKQMISVGKFPLSEIAFRSGFSSQASFTRAFRRATNMTPGEFRQHIR
ncbi:MAG TPA: AraC family transcriptional regulator [Roseiarcus sp.]|nr:AraC family transcriptional regulator [Roseiarcus sp.]